MFGYLFLTKQWSGDTWKTLCLRNLVETFQNQRLGKPWHIFLTQHKQQSAPRKSKVHECYSMLLMYMKMYYEYYDHVKKK